MLKEGKQQDSTNSLNKNWENILNGKTPKNKRLSSALLSKASHNISSGSLNAELM